MECGKPQIGGQYLKKKAQGQFCVVSMTVRNIGTKSQMFSGTSQKAIDAQGRELEADGGPPCTSRIPNHSVKTSTRATR